MNKQNKAIEEMAKVICQECITATEEKECLNNVKDCLAYDYAKIFYNAGYRNEKETAREILQEVEQLCKEQMDRFSHLCKSKKEAREETCRYEGVLSVKNRLGKLAERYDVEVE